MFGFWQAVAAAAGASAAAAAERRNHYRRRGLPIPPAPSTLTPTRAAEPAASWSPLDATATFAALSIAQADSYSAPEASSSAPDPTSWGGDGGMSGGAGASGEW